MWVNPSRKQLFPKLSGIFFAKLVVFKCLHYVFTRDLVVVINRTFKDPEIMKITRDDYFIFRTAEGHLYDTSVLET